MLEWQVFLNLVLTAAAYMAITFVAKRFLSNADTCGSPRYMYYISLTTTACIYSTLAYLAWQAREDQRASLWTWMATVGEPASLGGSDKAWQRAFVNVFVGCLLKDTTSTMTPDIWVHHIACIVAALGMLFVEPINAFVVGVLVLEVGSSGLNLHYLFLTNELLLRVYMVLMVLSNIVALVIACVFWTVSAPMFPARAAFSLVTVALVVIRQLVSNSNYSAFYRSNAKKA